MKSLFVKKDLEEIKNRLLELQATAERKWGTMTPSQALEHLRRTMEIGLGTRQVGLKPNPLVRLIIMLMKPSLYNDKPWKPNLRTAKELRITHQPDFDQEMILLKKAIAAFAAQERAFENRKHPIFGKLTKEQWGQNQYKHIDHHLRQFGA